MKIKNILAAVAATLITVNVFAQQIVWKQKASLPEPIYHGKAVTYNNKIYVFASLDKDYNDNNNVFIYDIANDQWSTKPGKAINANKQAVVCVNGLIYILGDNTDIYNPITDTWAIGKIIPTRRSHVCDGALVDGKIYVMGGICLDNTCSNSNDVYDPQTNTWAKRAAIPESRIDAKTAVIDNKIYLFGGAKDNNFQPTSTVYVYDPVADNWEKKPSLSDAIILQGFAAIDHDLVFAGGFYNGIDESCISSQVFVYNVINNTWTQCNSLPKRIADPISATYKNSIYIIGGGILASPFTVFSEVYEGVLDNSLSATNELKTERIEVYPNPTSGLFSISLGTMPQKTVQAEIYTTEGRLILTKEFRNTTEATVDLSTYPDGMYLIKFFYEGFNYEEKIIKSTAL